MEKNEVLVFGSVAYDCIETVYAKRDYILGGSASYASLACSYFADTHMAGVVGKDFKQSDIQRLKNRNIDLSGLQIDNSGDTFFWRGKYFEDFNKRETLDVKINVFEHYKPQLPESLSTCQCVMLGNINPEHQLAVLEKIKSPKFVLVDTMDLWINIAKQDLLKLIPKADLFILNDSESAELTGCDNIFKAADEMKKLGAKNVLIKKGEHGSVLFHKDGMFIAPAYPVSELRDPTGAGDSYAGALIGKMAGDDDFSFKSMKNAMLYAAAVASLTVEDFSCDKLEKSGFAEVEKRTAFLREITTV